jgi:MFS family permease
LALESAGILLLTIGIKSIGFLSFALDPIDRVENEAKPWRAILGYRDFNLYLMAFVLFMVAAGLVSLLWQGLPPTPEYDAVTRTATILRYVGLCVFAIITGLMADRIGRKKPIILGLVMLGAAYAIVGLLTTPETYFVNLLLSGFAWGIIMVVYLVVPGDLSFAGSAERFYTVGWVLPLVLYIGVEGTGKLIGFAPRIDIFSAILSVVLFASVLPLLSAVETLSESKLRERRFRKYAEEVGKVVEEFKETDQT